MYRRTRVSQHQTLSCGEHLMGGVGSGRWGRRSTDRKLTDTCVQLSMLHLAKEGALVPGRYSTFILDCPFRNLGIVFFVLDLDLTPRTYGKCSVAHIATDRSATRYYSVPIITTSPQWGGLRYWFCCPLPRNGSVCGRRVGKLYLPPGGAYFGCRQCYQLAYQSQMHQLKPRAVRRTPLAD